MRAVPRDRSAAARQRTDRLVRVLRHGRPKCCGVVSQAGVTPDLQWGQRDAVVVLTGATGYLGRALARAFADAGATLLLTARCTSTLAHVAEELAPCGSPIHTIAADLTDPAAGEQI